jgi:hypothetical protein
MDDRMKMYMGYSEYIGPCEGAVLIFSNTAKEAVKLLRESVEFDFENFTDARATLIRDCPWLEKEKVHDYPHIIHPKTCSCCDTWGVSEIGEDGLCDDCRAAK